jgi:hypothetical protein
MLSIQTFQHLMMTAQRLIALPTIDRVPIAQAIQAIDSHFREHILTGTTATDDHPHQAIYVEINKQLRLLKTDMLFLQSAKQAATQAQRVQQMRDRLTLLERYCEMILGD